MKRLMPVLVVLLAFFPILVAWDFGFESRHQPLIMLDSVNWSHDRTTLVQSNPGHVFLEVPQLYDGETLSWVEVRYRGGPGHTSDPVGLGISTPRLDVLHIDRDGQETLLCWAKDNPHQSPAEYEQAHGVTASGCAHHVQPASGRVVLVWWGEFTDGFYEGGPADFHDGAQILSVKTVTH